MMFLYLSSELVIEYWTIFRISCVQVCFYFKRSSLKVCGRFPKIKGPLIYLNLAMSITSSFKNILFYFKEKDFHCCKGKIKEVLIARDLYSALLTARCLQRKFFIPARACKKIVVLACSPMLAKTIRHPLW